MKKVLKIYLELLFIYLFIHQHLTFFSQITISVSDILQKFQLILKFPEPKNLLTTLQNVQKN